MDNKYFSSKSMYIVFGVLLLSIISGSIFCGMQNTAEGLKMSEYLTDFLKSVTSINKFQTAMGKIREYSVIAVIIFISAFFKAGILFNLGAVIRQGFVIGFTLSAFFKVFGVRGITAMLLMLPELLVFLLALLIFSSTSTKMAFLTFKNKKNFLIFFVFFSFFCAAIFCVSAFLNGYLTTIFMKWASTVIL